MVSVLCCSCGQSGVSPFGNGKVPSPAVPGSQDLTYGLQGNQVEQEPANGWPSNGSVEIEGASKIAVKISVQNNGQEAMRPECEVDVMYWKSFSLQSTPELVASNIVRDPSYLATSNTWLYSDVFSVPNGVSSKVNQVVVTCNHRLTP